MKIFKADKMKAGWYIGDFEPTVFKNKNFEAGVKTHKKNEYWPVHYHKIATEITYILKGKIKMQNKILIEGDIFIIYPYEIANPEFLEETTVLVIKTPSITNDKYNI